MSRESIPPSEIQSGILVRHLTTAELAGAVATTLDRLSPARASLVSDQVCGLLRSHRPDRLLMLTAGQNRESAEGNPLTAGDVLAIVLLPESGDTATILHVDWVNPGAVATANTIAEDRRGSATVGGETVGGETVGGNGPESERRFLPQQLGHELWQHLEKVFAAANLRFIQWATDPTTVSIENAPVENAVTPASWAGLMGFSPIGTLDYLALDPDETGKWSGKQADAIPANSPEPFTLQTLDHDVSDFADAFEQLIRRTYVDSLDCPPFEQFRSVDEILAGYRSADAFAPDLWFTVSLQPQSHNAKSTPIGAIILTRHPGPSLDDPDQINPASVVELVYMGIVPEHRGHGHGTQIMSLIADICEQQNADRLILAVDQNNHPAITAYRRIGMHPLFCETVWGRLVNTLA